MPDTNFIEILDKIGDEFLGVFSKRKDTHFIETKDYGWFNARYSSPNFRVAHIEKFIQEKFAAIHVCVFPNINDPSPIFGFDIISGKSKITGLFYDLSPVGYETSPFINFIPTKPRERPEWGDIFSNNWVACKPTVEELDTITKNAYRVLENYLDNLPKISTDINTIIEKQNRYCKQQKLNDQTFSALKFIIGEELASEFMDEVLFPEIK